MRIGVIYPQTEFGDDPSLIRDFAQTVEALGYSHLLVFDHVLGAQHEGRDPALTGPYTERSAFHEPLILLGHLAAATTSLELATGVLILPQRQAPVVAKQAAEVDILSGGRLRLGVGAGWNYVEYEALNMDWESRGRRYTEQIEVMRQLWEQDLVDFTGRFHRIDRANILPRPKRRIPVWFGGSTDAAFRRAGRLGEGFIFNRVSSLAESGIEKVRTAASEAGRDPAVLGFDTFVDWAPGADRWKSDLERWQAAGGTHASLRTMGAGLATPQDHLDAIRNYADAVGLSG